MSRPAAPPPLTSMSGRRGRTVGKETPVNRILHSLGTPRGALRGAGVVGTALAVALTLGACGGGAPTPHAAAATGAPAAPSDGGPQQRAVPGASGEIAAVTGTTAQVQSSDSQTAVTWTATTKVTQQVAGAFADVKVGACVTAIALSPTSGGTAPSATPDITTPLAATSVIITPASSDGTCRGGFGGFAGGGPRRGGAGGGGFPGGRPSGLPTDRPSGAPRGGRAGGAFGRVAAGKVTAVSGDGFTVDQTTFARSGRGGASPAPSATPSTTTVQRQVTVSSSTTYTATRSADASAIVVGQCMTAFGSEDSAGAITATTITLSQPTANGCASGFGGFGRAGRGQTANPAGGSNA